jgi:arabinogalactan endo-1,4-beta-galactosidase
MARRIPATIATSAALVAVLAAGAPAASGAGDSAARHPGPVGHLRDGGFEDGLRGWSVHGDHRAVALDGPGRPGGTAALRVSSPSSSGVAVTQPLAGLSRGWWTVSAWVRSGGAVDASSLALSGCGGDASRTVPTTEQDAQWVRLSVSADVRSPAGCSVVLRTRGTAGVWLDVDDVSVAPGRVQRSVRGVDLSSLAKNQDHGAVYRDVRGHRVDPVRLLAASGANVGRLKVWVDPADGYNDTAHVVATARRITAAGMRLLVDFHYSDRWADPGAQAPPAAWAGFTAPQMADAVAKHTTSVLTALKRAGISADYVQVGNEINPGLLLPLGQTYDVNPDDAVAGAQWANVAAFLTAGARAVKAVDPRAQVLLHLTNINNGVDGLTWWFDNVTARNVPFDAIGLSYYSYWHGSLGDLQNAVSTLSARYDKDVIVLETSYPWTLADDPVSPYANVIDQPGQLAAGYPATPQGQAANFAAVQDAVVSAPGGRGLGAVYWEPAWTSVAGAGWDPSDPSSGDAWDNQAMFDHSGRVLPAARALAPDRVTRPR